MTRAVVVMATALASITVAMPPANADSTFLGGDFSQGVLPGMTIEITAGFSAPADLHIELSEGVTNDACGGQVVTRAEIRNSQFMQHEKVVLPTTVPSATSYSAAKSFYRVGGREAGAKLTNLGLSIEWIYQGKSHNYQCKQLPMGKFFRITNLASIILPNDKLYPGDTVSANPGLLSPTADTLTYEWSTFAQGVPLKVVGTDPTYTVGQDEAGKTLIVRVNHRKDDYLDQPLSATAKIETGKQFTTLPQVQLDVANLDDEDRQVLGLTTLTADITGGEPSLDTATATSHSTKWYRVGSPNTVVFTGPSFTPPASDAAGTAYFSVTSLNATIGGIPHLGTVTSPNSEPFAKGFIAAPTVLLSGSPVVDGTLTASVNGGEPSAASTTKAFQWLADGEPLDGETGSSLTLTTAHFDKAISVRVTSTLSGYLPNVTERAQPGKIGEGTLTLPVPTLTGNARPDESLTCVPPTGGGDAKYQWFIGEDKAGTSATQLLRPEWVNATVRCETSVKRVGYKAVVGLSEGVQIEKGFQQIPSLQIFGAARVGSALTCALPPGTPGNPSVRWLRGEEVRGNGVSYAPTSADLGSRLTCEMTVQRPGYHDAVVTEQTDEVSRGAFVIGAPVVTGTPRIGHTLTCTAPRGTPGLVSYSWMRGVRPLAEGPHYTPRPADLDSALTCVATAVAPDYDDATSFRHTAAIGKGLLKLPSPTISGEAVFDQELTCTSPAIDVESVTVVSSWVGQNGPLTLGNTYKPGLSDLGNSLKCVAQATSPFYEDASSSAFSEPIDKATFEIPAPEFVGVAKVGAEISCVPGEGTLGTASVSIAKSGAAAYTPVPEDLGSRLECAVSSQREGYYDATASALSDEVALGTFTIEPPVITGSGQVGAELVCVPAIDTPGKTAVRWVQGDSELAEGSRFTPKPALLGQSVTCEVQSSRAGYADAVNSTESAEIAKGTFTIEAPSIKGTSQVGNSLKCLPPEGLDQAIATSAQWLRGDETTVDGFLLDLVGSDFDTTPTCTVTASQDGYEDAQSSVSAGVVAAGVFEIDAPTIEGAPVVDQEMTCLPSTTGPQDAEYAYLWRAGEESLAKTAAFTPDAALVDQAVTCEVTASRPGYLDATSQKETEAIAPGTFSIEAPVITGVAKVGAELVCAPALDTIGTTSLRWLQGETEVAAGGSFTPGAALLGKVVTCEVTSERAGYEPATNNAVSQEIGKGTFTIPEPTITGTPQVEETLTCLAPGNLPDGVTATTSWVRGEDESVASSTLDLVASDLDSTPLCVVTATREGYEDAENSTSADPIKPGVFELAEPSIVGTAVVEGSLTCVPGAGPDGVEYGYVWRDGELVVGDSATLNLGAELVGKSLNCEVTAKRFGYVDATAAEDSAPIEPGTFEVPAPVISQAPQVGVEVSCDPAEATLGNATTAWFIGEQAVGQGSAFTPGPEHAGLLAVCVVTSERAGYNAAQNRATADPVALGEAPAFKASIAGTTQVGRTLTASVQKSVVLPLRNKRETEPEVAYQWQVAGVDVEGATTPNFRVPLSAFGKVVTVRAVVSVPGYQPSTASADTEPMGIRPLSMTLTPERVREGDRVFYTLANLLPGQRYEITYGNLDVIVQGRVPAGVERIEGSFRATRLRGDEDQRYVRFATTGPDRERFLSLVVRPRR